MMISDPLDMTVDKFVEQAVAIVKDTDSVDIAIAKLAATPFGKVLMVNAAGLLNGVITQYDLVKLRNLPKEATATALATQDRIIAINPGAPLRDVIRLLNGNNSIGKVLDALPVVDAQHRPIGILTRRCLNRMIGDVSLRPVLA